MVTLAVVIAAKAGYPLLLGIFNVTIFYLHQQGKKQGKSP